MEAYSLWSVPGQAERPVRGAGQAVTPLDILSGYVKGNSNGGWVKQGDFEVNPATGETPLHRPEVQDHHADPGRT
jgi:hypothetical protein